MSEHLEYYLGPLTQLLSLWGLFMGGDYVWIAIAWLPVLALLDTVLPTDLRPRRIRSHALAYIPIWISALMGPCMYVMLAWSLNQHDLSGLQIAAAVIGTAWLSVLPLVSASHELYHARGRIGKTVGRYVQVCFLDPTRMEAHVVGHHIDVGTSEDSDTALRGETLYNFSPRAVIKSTIQAQKIMCDALERKGKRRWSIGHPLWRAILSQVIFQSLLWTIGGWAAVAAALAAMVIARFWVETFNYFQHYGQVRVVGAPIEKRHVWNHFGTLSRLCAFEITNHADHHLNSYQAYFELKPHADSVRMPNVFICFFAALVPPIWFRYIIKPALKQWDLQYANAEERQLAAAQNRKAGWEDWFSQGKLPQRDSVSHA
ncbi:MAG TPA: alkane 1-monooxygenase [Steroidobacteraceae bacterium]|jgi:alkane 1-monooxygenase/p-cymene monooxygenase